MPLEGMQIGRYRFIRMLGSGGMGEVYLAEDARIGQQVAIKVIRAEPSTYPDENATKEATRLFQREAMAIAKLDHPNILPLFDYGEGNINGATLTYLVMPFRQEGSLVDWLRRNGGVGPLWPQDIVHIVGQTADALQHAHDHQIIHQDVKPSNLLIRERKDAPNSPEVLLADFGIAKSATATASTSQVIRGTPTYMAPEQWEAHPVPASDQYALAIMAYELLTGRPPFQGGSVQMMYQHFNVQPQPPSTFNKGLSSDVDAVLLNALAKKPTDRFGSISAFTNALQQAVQSASGSILMKAPNVLNPAGPNDSAPQSDAQGSISALPNRNPTGSVTGIAAPSSIRGPQSEEPTPTSRSKAPFDSRGTNTNELAGPNHTPKIITTADMLPIQVNGNAVVQALEAPTPGVVKRKRPRRRSRRLLAVVLVLLAVVLTFGSVAYAITGGFASLVERLSGTSSATVTILPKSEDLKNTYAIPAVTGTPNTAQHQVQARQLSNTTSPQSQTANATGSSQIPATNAKGTLDYTCGINDRPDTISAGTVLTGHDGVQVVTDATETENCGGPSVITYVPAHAVQPGQSGNIAAGDMYYPNHASGHFYDVTNNTAFSGGADAQTVPPVILQSDIDGATNTLISANTPDPQQSLQSQIHSNEQLVSSPECKPNVISNHVAGDQATTVTVTVSFTCTGEVYDQQGTLTTAKQWLIQDAAKNRGNRYMLVGNLVTKLVGAQVSDAKQGTISVSVIVEGIWVYKFDNAQEQTLAKLIAGKKKATAQSLLSQQPGVMQVNVQLTGGDRDALPIDPNQIKFVVLNVKGK